MGKTDPKYEALFTPWKVGNVEIKNRIVMCPMGGTSLFGWFELGGCHFDKEAAKLFLERANNNVGLIIPGIAPLRDTFWGKWLWQNPKMFDELKEFADKVNSIFTSGYHANSKNDTDYGCIFFTANKATEGQYGKDDLQAVSGRFGKDDGSGY